MANNFSEITIVDIIPKEAAAAGTGQLMNVPFALSATPTADWQRYFYSFWKNYFNFNKRKATITGNRIICVCLVDEIPTVFDQLKNAIEEANKKYQADLDRIAKASADAAKKQKEVIDQIEEVKKKLGF